MFLSLLCNKDASMTTRDCIHEAAGKQMFFKALQLCMACLWQTQICAVNLLYSYFVFNLLFCYLLSLNLNTFIYFINSFTTNLPDRLGMAEDLSAWKTAVMV